MNHASSFKELNTYKLAKEISFMIFTVTKTFPVEERYALTDQIRRSSRSVGAQIAESWGKRRYEKHFISKLTDADAENLETQHWIDISFECNYLDESQHKELINKCEIMGKMINNMIQKSNEFCKNNE